MLTLCNFITRDNRSIRHNDSFFNTITTNKILSGDRKEEALSLIEAVESVKAQQNCTFISKFTGKTLDLDSLSTGTKTLLNIFYNPDRIVDLSECGDNIIDKILSLKTGLIYLNRYYRPSSAMLNQHNIRCLSADGSSFVTDTFMEAMSWNDAWKE